MMGMRVDRRLDDAATTPNTTSMEKHEGYEAWRLMCNRTDGHTRKTRRPVDFAGQAGFAFRHRNIRPAHHPLLDSDTLHAPSPHRQVTERTQSFYD